MENIIYKFYKLVSDLEPLTEVFLDLQSIENISYSFFSLLDGSDENIEQMEEFADQEEQMSDDDDEDGDVEMEQVEDQLITRKLFDFNL